MAKTLIIPSFPPTGASASTITSSRAFITKQKRRLAQKMTVLAAGEEARIGPGNRVEVVLTNSNEVLFPEAEIVLTGPLLFWQEPAPMPTERERYRMLGTDPSAESYFGCVVFGALSAIMLIVAILVNSAGVSFFALLLAALFGVGSFACYKVGTACGKVNYSYTTPTDDFFKSIPGLSMEDFYPQTEKAEDAD